MKKEIKLTLPLYIRKKAMNLNQYRNSHYFDLNKQKHFITTLALEQLPPEVKLKAPVQIHYELYAKTTNCDLLNFTVVLDKYLQDSLVLAGTIPNDTVKTVTYVTTWYKGIDKDNPRLEVTVIGE